MANKPDNVITRPATKNVPDIKERMNTEYAALVVARDQLRLQLNGVENQLYILDKLLNPAPAPTSPSETPPDTI